MVIDAIGLYGEAAEATKCTDGVEVEPLAGEVVTTSAKERQGVMAARMAQQMTFFSNDLLLVRVETTKVRQNASNRLRRARNELLAE